MSNPKNPSLLETAPLPVVTDRSARERLALASLLGDAAPPPRAGMSEDEASTRDRVGDEAYEMLKAFVSGADPVAAVAEANEQRRLAEERRQRALAAAARAEGDSTQEHVNTSARDHLLDLVDGVRRDRGRKLTPVPLPVAETNAWLSMGRRSASKKQG